MENDYTFEDKQVADLTKATDVEYNLPLDDEESEKL